MHFLDYFEYSKPLVPAALISSRINTPKPHWAREVVYDPFPLFTFLQKDKKRRLWDKLLSDVTGRLKALF
jgi:hypothetical protein